MEKAELIFIPGPGMGHLFPAVEFGKLLTKQDERFYIVFLIISLPYNTGIDSSCSLSTLVDKGSRISFLNIDLDQESASELRNVAAVELIESCKPQVREAVLGMNMTRRVAGVIVDMFSHCMIDVAHEFQLPSFMFFTSSAGFLGLVLQVQTLKNDYNQEISDYKDSEAEILVPSFQNPVPAKVLPTTMLEHPELLLELSRNIRKCKGIIVNTFLELEPYAIKSLSDQDRKIPRIHPTGPIINHSYSPDDGIMSWLDNQPTASVIFLCFGSLGSFNKEQVMEIAVALENCGYRFLWSLRRPPAKGEINAPDSYADPEEVLPKGFLDRTSSKGKVVGWVPQVAILAHPAVGGFVSHCGWNSILEATWFGVPVAAWPMHAEQQVNAFEMITELEIAVEIKMDYRHDVNNESKIIVSSEEIEKGIKNLMMMDESKNEMRKKITDLKEKSQKAMIGDGSSQTSLGHLIDDVLNKIPWLGQEK